MKSEIIESLKSIVGEDWITYDLSKMQRYLYDETEPLLRPEACKDCVVVKPGSAEEISEILKYSNKTLTPVVARGGGTGVVGGVIPTESSIILSLERLNKIVEFDEKI